MEMHNLFLQLYLWNLQNCGDGFPEKICIASTSDTKHIIEYLLCDDAELLKGRKIFPRQRQQCQPLPPTQGSSYSSPFHNFHYLC